MWKIGWIKCDSYVPARWSSTVESMVFTLFSLHTRRASHDRCRDILTLFIPFDKTLIEFSRIHFTVYHNKGLSKSTTPTRYAIQYETKRNFSMSQHSKQNKQRQLLHTNETRKIHVRSDFNFRWWIASLKEHFFTLSRTTTILYNYIKVNFNSVKVYIYFYENVDIFHKNWNIKMLCFNSLTRG